MRLQGKVAIVTGGASGFGAGIARNRQVGSVMSYIPVMRNDNMIFCWRPTDQPLDMIVTEDRVLTIGD